MPELVANGVDIPLKLREELEEGKVVFFCGAGVSIPSGLPSFKDLTDKVLEELNYKNDVLINKALDNNNYDKIFNLLERPEKYNVLPKDLRAIVAKILKPKPNANISPHKTLLKLSLDQNGFGRLVSTNFDVLFEKAYKELYPKIDYDPDTCPRLPIPKNENHWKSIVHLHGWLNDKRDPEHKNLVLSSSDFGRAYLVEGWASRFVTELFRHYRVVFIGYQVEDPVMKYLIDALAEAQGEGFKSAYAFASYDPSVEKNEQYTKELWKSKGGIEALTYQVEKKDHSTLWQTLEAWADLHQGGFDSKCSIVTKYAGEQPDTLYPDDIENMVWAISQPDGNIAKVFAEINISWDPLEKSENEEKHTPSYHLPPPIEWLPIFEERGLLVVNQNDLKTPIVTQSTFEQRKLNDVCYHLCRWLIRHMDKIEFLNWVLEKGTILHYEFRRDAKIKLENNNFEMPTGMRKIWNLILSENYVNKYSVSSQRHLSLNVETPQLKEPYTIQLYLNALHPIPKIKKHINLNLNFGDEGKSAEESKLTERPRAYADIDITFMGSNYPKYFIKALENSEAPNEVLIKIIDPLTDILLEIMDLFNYFDQADNKLDLSYIHRPSISTHNQNRNFDKWTIILELLRRAIEASKHTAPDILETVMNRWFRYDYPVFKRLILYATIGGNNKISDIALQVLISEKRGALWLPSCMREVMRLLRHANQVFTKNQLEKLTDIILEGPSRKYFKEMSDQDWDILKSKKILHRLKKLEKSKFELSKEAKNEIENINCKYPNIDFSEGSDHRDEFPFYMFSGSSSYESDFGLIRLTPDQINEMPDDKFKEYILEYSQFDEAWLDYCTDQPLNAFSRLKFFADQNNQWPSHRWSPALSCFRQLMSCTSQENREYKFDKEFAEEVLNYISTMPTESFKDLTLEVARFIEFRTFAEEVPNKIYWDIWEKLWATSCDSDTEITKSDLITVALNSTCGELANQLIYHFSNHKPKVNTMLYKDIEKHANKVVEGKGLGAMLGRVILISRLSFFFNFTPDWSKEKLVPLLSKEINPNEWLSMWNGFMWSPRVNPNLFFNIKDNFFNLLEHIEEYAKNFEGVHNGDKKVVRLFGYLCIPEGTRITKQEAKKHLNQLNDKQLAEVAYTLKTQLRDVGENKAAILWQEQIKPWFLAVWPITRIAKKNLVSRALAEMCLNTKEAFPDCVKTLLNFLDYIDSKSDNSLIYNLSKQSDFPRIYPKDTLILLHKLVNERPKWHNDYLKEVLEIIIKADPSLMSRTEYKKLRSITGI